MLGTKFIITGRRMGKTTWAINWLKSDPQNNLLLVPHSLLAKSLIARTKDPNVTEENLVAFREAFDFEKQKLKEKYKGKNIAIDNVEWALAEFFEKNIDLITGTESLTEIWQNQILEKPTCGIAKANELGRGQDGEE